MRIIDCYWEKRNLNCSVAEVVVEANDQFIAKDFKELQEYDYVVVKVPMNKMDFNYGLSDLGFAMIEYQVEMYANMDTFNFEERNLNRVSRDFVFEEIGSEVQLDELLSRITPGMFSTDRICLDPKFGFELGCIRYKNWLKDIFNDPQSRILNFYYQDKHVGFGSLKETSEVKGLLGGLFSEYQNYGIGLLIPCAGPLYAKRKNLPIKKIFNPISSNNREVWCLYEHFGFIPKRPHYVFVKHNH